MVTGRIVALAGVLLLVLGAGRFRDLVSYKVHIVGPSHSGRWQLQRVHHRDSDGEESKFVLAGPWPWNRVELTTPRGNLGAAFVELAWSADDKQVAVLDFGGVFSPEDLVAGYDLAQGRNLTRAESMALLRESIAKRYGRQLQMESADSRREIQTAFFEKLRAAESRDEPLKLSPP